MEKPHLRLVVCAVLAATAAFAQTSYVFQMPGATGLTPQIVGLGDNDFHRSVSTAKGPAASTRVVATPNGSKFYILAPGGIYSGNATLSTVAPVSAISGVATVADVTPDGKYLLAITDHFYILNSSTDSLAGQADTGVPTGSTPIAFAVSHDSKTAWVLSNTTAGSTVIAVNLTNFQTVGSPLNLPNGASSMVLSARGLLYVTTTADRLYEIDPVSLSLTTSGQMQVTGIAGPLQFTPDGNTAYFLNKNVCSACPPIFKLNASGHTISGWVPSDGSAPPAVDQILVAGNNRVFGLTFSTMQLWDITPTPLGLTPSVIGALPTSSVLAAAVSNERPSPRYLYLLVADHSFYRVNLAASGIDGVSSLDPANGTILAFVPIPAASGTATLFQVNPSQNVTPGGTAVLIAEALDPVGRPVFGVPASFSADPASGITIATPSVITTSEGWAQTVVTAPATSGTYPVAISSGALSAKFQLIVGNGSTTGSSQISISAGDGQLLRQNESTIESQQPLKVRVTDAAGNPLANIAVAFAVSDGIGTVNPTDTTTDTGGFAFTNFTSAPLQLNIPYALSKVTATSSFGAAEFYEVTHDALANDPHPPNSEILTPVNQKLTIPQGGFISGAITARTLSGHSGQPIPNVGLRIADNTNLTAPSTVASCVGTSRADSNGVSQCNLLAACQANAFIPPDGLDFGAIIEVGEYKSYGLTIHVTPGTPSALNIVSGNNQTGTPGSTFTLFARVTDGCSQASANFSGLAWTVLQGGASLAQSQTVSDSSGNVSTRVTLGSTAGAVRVQLSGPGLSPVIFNLTTQVIVSGISLVSGGGQSAIVGQAFANPVIFLVRDSNSNPLPGIAVTFSVSGSATVNPGSATTDAQGHVQTTVTAGATPSNIVVTAAYNTLTATASLSSRAAGPTITSASFTNAASGAAGMTPCGLVTVTGNGIASTAGVVTGQNLFGLWPTTLAGLSITANNVPVPIQAVINDQFGQRANFQAPCELTPGTATVVVTVNGASTTVSGVPVAAIQPGIFTFAGANNKQYGIVIHASDGTFVTSSNPARRGDQYYMIVTGLGQVTPATTTGAIGTGTQDVKVALAVGIHDLGITPTSARYLAGYIGAYRVDFVIPPDAPLGPDQNMAIAAYVNGTDLLFGNPVLLPAVIAAPAP